MATQYTNPHNFGSSRLSNMITSQAVNGATNGRRDSVALDDSASNEVSVEQLRRAVVDELSALRCEVDVLKKGGWKVAIGPFMQTSEQDEFDLHKAKVVVEERIRAKIEKSVPELLKVDRASSVAPVVPAAKPTEDVEPLKPAYVRSLRKLTTANFPSKANMNTFSLTFLMKLFHGAMEHSPGLWYIPKHAGGCLIPNRTFYAMSAEYEPFLPVKPCDHGAKLTAFFNPDPPSDGGEAGYEDVPLFISVKDQPGRYIYFGTYSQTRWSDRVSYDVLSLHVPEKVKEYWAGQLADPARPEWVTRQLMKHFFPMPEYDGPMPAGTPTGSEVTSNEDEEKKAKKVTKAVKNYVEELKLWEKEASTKVGLMNKENMMTAFDKADADENPGLRLWWEYLECKQWDKAFYEMLVNEQKKHDSARR